MDSFDYLHPTYSAVCRNHWRGIYVGFYTSRSVYSQRRVLFSLGKQLYDVFFGSERDFLKSEEITTNDVNGVG